MKVKVSETTKQVVQDALNGSRIVAEDVYYFCTPTAPGRGWFETDLSICKLYCNFLPRSTFFNSGWAICTWIR